MFLYTFNVVLLCLVLPDIVLPVFAPPRPAPPQRNHPPGAAPTEPPARRSPTGTTPPGAAHRNHPPGADPPESPTSRPQSERPTRRRPTGTTRQAPPIGTTHQAPPIGTTHQAPPIRTTHQAPHRNHPPGAPSEPPDPVSPRAAPPLCLALSLLMFHWESMLRHLSGVLHGLSSLNFHSLKSIYITYLASIQSSTGMSIKSPNICFAYETQTVLYLREVWIPDRKCDCEDVCGDREVYNEIDVRSTDQR